ncbi:putative heme/steroid binding protein [Candidatus Methanoperedens nitroreducens]|uniref:Putative heme/steroid binding protein n=1 Tax=Candidatus Methanoperedens nitratireducens TaxID=1392998 RepID=A0A062V1Q4_9EURY|nr:response regulator [Candidatus Methanoperedens nitroreducens]KCZ73016.1 putative heme/steroid binding protein [Candidatus Methanoperedens nitroreducens]MDJ1423040.1 response regulator [Candidatus Methanoperedens sp.]
MEHVNVLLIEDNPGDARLIKEMLIEAKNISFDIEWKDRLSSGLERITMGGVDVVLLDLILPDSPRGFDTFTRTQAQAPEVPIVVLTGLDDETFAINAVRRGAQDYLIKGKVDSNLLTRTIRYSIARKLGEERHFTAMELREFDGKEGRPAYAAFKGKVYDVSNSSLWRDGIHAGSHFAGTDLTENMLRATHGEEVLVKFHIVGELSPEKTFRQRLVQRIEGLHLHPILVHFSIAYSVAIPLLAFLYIFTEEITFEIASYYILVLGLLTAPLATLSGLFSWKVTYAEKMTKVFARKIIFAIALIVVTTVSFMLRTLYTDILTEVDLNYYTYLALLVSLAPIVTVLGYDGGKIVYS